ncbi:MAG: sugar ABC transporter permease [Chloroflexia bacterium]|nr:sugar ABC transporter permease [Chloroflexia bacterium]
MAVPRATAAPTASGAVGAAGAGARQRRRFVLLMLAPSTILLMALTLYPFLTSLWLSVTDYTLLAPNDREFIGLENYRELLASAEFWGALRLTAVFCLFAVGLETLIGVGVALMLHAETRRVGWLRAVYMVPMAITPVAATFTFRLMYSPSLGVFNHLLERVGLPPQTWLADPRLALPSLLLVDIWQWTPFILLIVVGGLSVLPQEPFEAAMLDGAAGWRLFRDITLPFLWPFLTIAILFRAIDAFKTFDIIYVLTGGGPGTSTRTLNLLAFKQGIEFLEMGYAAAISILMLVIVMVFAQIFVRRTGLIRGMGGSS